MYNMLVNKDYKYIEFSIDFLLADNDSYVYCFRFYWAGKGTKHKYIQITKCDWICEKGSYTCNYKCLEI